MIATLLCYAAALAMGCAARAPPTYSPLAPLEPPAYTSYMPAPPPPLPDTCAASWAQCGGIGWVGATSCCDEEYGCGRVDPMYFQCQPRTPTFVASGYFANVKVLTLYDVDGNVLRYMPGTDAELASVPTTGYDPSVVPPNDPVRAIRDYCLGVLEQTRSWLQANANIQVNGTLFLTSTDALADYQIVLNRLTTLPTLTGLPAPRTFIWQTAFPGYYVVLDQTQSTQVLITGKKH